MRKLASSPAVASRYTAALTSQMIASKAEAVPSEFMSEAMVAESTTADDDQKAQEDLKKMIDYLGPPTELQILNPFKTKDTPDEKDNLTIRDIVLWFQAVSLLSVPHAKHQDNTRFGQKWKLCQDNLENEINKFKQGTDSARNALETQRGQYTKTTIMGVLEIFGALALFAIAAFTMPYYGLLAIGAGVYLLYKGIKDLTSLAGIDAAIERFKSAANTADTTNKNLTKVADAVAKVITIWDAIAQSLVNIQTFVGVWSSPKVFIASVGSVTTEWGKVKDNCIAYIGVISGGTPA
ncbi:hypothetical protein RB597_008535 [Gaeumannomyces tritici]